MLAHNIAPQRKYMVSCSHWGLFPDDNYIGHFDFCVPPELSDEEYAAREAEWQRQSEDRAKTVAMVRQGLAEGATVTKLARRLGIPKRKVEFFIKRYGLART